MPKQEIKIVAFSGRLPRILRLKEPALTLSDSSDTKSFHQLNYIGNYARHHGCETLLIERHYIDRDYMEDHSAFYSRNLVNYRNYCTRVHFFKGSPKVVQRRLDALTILAAKNPEEGYEHGCAALSDDLYLGFTVIKPLPGSPVGRTVLRCFDGVIDGSGLVKSFSAAKNYSVHIGVISLSVTGLGFQQQDVGVSACATTALWSSLQKVKDSEDIGSATPAQITLMAAQYSLPFGRAMPSEGLSTGQMCQAVQALGIAPNLIRTESYEQARACLYSALKSNMAVVLILSLIDTEAGGDEEERYTGDWHAVAVAGYCKRELHVPSSRIDFPGGLPDPEWEGIDDLSSDLAGLYVQDDRHGPYLRTDLKKDDGLHGKSKMRLTITIGDRTPEEWHLTHILIPIHPKVRLSFGYLQEVATAVVAEVLTLRELIEGSRLGTTGIKPVAYETWIQRSYKYLQTLLLESKVPKFRIEKLSRGIALSRYVAVIRVSCDFIGQVDVVIDTTGTYKNSQVLAILSIKNSTAMTDIVLNALAKTLGAPHIV